MESSTIVTFAILGFTVLVATGFFARKRSSVRKKFDS